MFEVYPGNWPAAVDATDPRNQFHEKALHEARVASEYRQFEPVLAARSSLIGRIRLAFAGGPAATTETCTCPA